MRIKKLYFLPLIICAISLFTDNKCNAQNIYANGSIDKDSISVGQPFDYKLDVRIPSDYSLDWTELKDTLSSSIEIIRMGEITKTPINNSNDLIVSQILTLTSFDTGYVEIPKIGIRYSKAVNDTNILTCYTNYLDIYVEAAVIDTTAAYKPIKMPIKQSITFVEIAPFAGGGLLLAIIVLLIIYLIKRNKNKETIEEEIKPQIPAIITARERLGLLEESKLWQSGKMKEYYTDLTDIAREYLEGQFGIEAIEMTSDEILAKVSLLKLDELTFKKLQNTLFTADLVKFAKANPSTSENESAFNDISSFIEDSYAFHQELEKRKAEDAKQNRYVFEDDSTEKQDKEETT